MILRTGHEIADTVADALVGCPEFYGAIGYGILRGNAGIFKKSKIWFELDRGYFNPGHYDGYYRISCLGTQQTSRWPEPDYDRLKVLNLDVKPWRGFDKNKPVLVCPPTDQVKSFFDLSPWLYISPQNYIVREKGDKSEINFQDYNYVMTFNSSVGWQALAAGIPCVSDTTHSMVGAWYKNILLENLSEAQYLDRERLFATMSSLQFTLREIRAGDAWALIERYL